MPEVCTQSVDTGFVALGYLSRDSSPDGLRYLLAGQPPPLKRSADGTVTTLPLPAHRLPLGAMTRGRHTALDVSDPRAVEKFNPGFDRLDVLVLAQGAVIYRRGEFEMEGFRKVLEVNLMSLMACATKFHSLLGAAKGSLIIVSSTAAYHSTMGNPAYNASKTGAMGLTRTLGEAWAGDGIRVNGIAPGLVDTKMTRVTTSNPKRLEGAIERIPLKRLGTPADMAGAALFFASPLSSYIVGQTLIVDGGLLL